MLYRNVFGLKVDPESPSGSKERNTCQEVEGHSGTEFEMMRLHQEFNLRAHYGL